MGCEGKVADVKDLWSQVPDSRQPTIQQDSECSEGYLARAGNPSGEQTGLAPQDDVSAVPKIATISINVRCDLSIDVQMKATTAKPGLTWTFLDSGNAPIAISGITFGTDGHITGTFAAEGKQQFTVALMDGATETDSKPYTIVVAKCVPGADIKFIHPLPGSVMTSPCGERIHPVTGVKKAHKGCDFAYGDRHLGNVVASADGEVIFTGIQNGYGNLIMIGHTNAAGKKMCITKYAHLSKIGVSMGQRVAAGDVIGVEGNTGVGTGAHLHFEIRSGTGQGDQVFDPAAYIHGKVFAVDKIATTADGSPDPGAVASTATTTSQDNGAVALEPQKVDSPCSGYQTKTGQTLTGSDPTLGDATSSAPVTSPMQSDCKPSPYTAPAKSEVVSRINAILDADSALDAEDKKLILFIAKIESQYDPFAKNPTSSAIGLYQFLDALANKYFPVVGLQPTCENRCDIEKSTTAMVAFYKSEILNYYNGWVASGNTKIAGKVVVSTPHSLRYPTLTKGCWCYGLIHHDGVGNAVKGIDRQGCEYYMSKINGTA